MFVGSSQEMKQSSNIVNLITSNNTGICISLRAGPAMPLNDCIDHVLKTSGISNPMDSFMSNIRSSISKKIPKELFEPILNDYAGLLSSNLTVFPLDKNMLIDSEQCSTFPKISSVTSGQATFEYQVFLLYDHVKELFEPIGVVAAEGGEQYRFNSEEVASIWKEIGNFIDQRNREKMPVVESTINSDVDTNDLPAGLTLLDDTMSSFSFVEHDFSADADDALKNNLQIIIELIAAMAPQLNCIQLQTKKLEAVLNDFSRSSAEQKIELVIQLMKSVMEDFCIAAIPDPEAGGISLPQAEVEEYFAKLDNAGENEAENTTSRKRKMSNDAATSNAKRSSIKTASARSSRMPVKSYPAPRISRNSARYQRIRMFSELAQGGCPVVQAENKNSSLSVPMEIEVPPKDGVEVCLAVRAVKVGKTVHPINSVVAKNPKIDLSSIEKDGERKCLKLPKSQYDPETQYAFLPIIDAERRLRKKDILAHLFKWKQQGAGLRARKIENNLQMCYLEFRFCVPNGPEEYEFVSDPSYSSIIEDADGLVLINPKANENKQLCERGGQCIALPLSVTCPKEGISIYFNGKLQNNTVFKIKDKELRITSPKKTTKDPKLRLKVVRYEYNELIGSRADRTLYNDTFDFVPYKSLTEHSCVKQPSNSTGDKGQ